MATTTSTINTSSYPSNRNGRESNTVESVWGNIGFDPRFDRQTQPRPVNASVVPAGALDEALRQAWAEITRG